jgi:FAD:protein FMN transferase
MKGTLETHEAFPAFGSTCAALVGGEGTFGTSAAAVAEVRRCLTDWHDRFTRFEPTSELSRLNADPRETVPVSRIMGRFIAAVVGAARQTGGLVDATLLRQLEDAGYRSDLSTPMPLELALSQAPPRVPAGPDPASRWREIELDPAAGTVTRPPGLMLDSGGIAKGLFADQLATALATHPSFAVDCAGDLRIGGRAGLIRPVQVASPFDERILHTFQLVEGGVATSGIGRRSWLDANGVPAHHLLNPATGWPAFTGIVQATALAPTALEAEIRAKAAILSGPDGAEEWLPHGGAIVFDDGSHDVIPANLPVRSQEAHRVW